MARLYFIYLATKLGSMSPISTSVKFTSGKNFIIHASSLAVKGSAGTVKFYVDTRVAGFYLLWTVTRVDYYEFPGASYDMVAWTPRRQGDNIRTAGFRMTHAALLELLFVKADEWKCEDWAIKDMSGYGDVSILLGACSTTTHKTQAALKSRLASMPKYLQPLYEEGASVTGKDSIF